jgi:site-specific recombinase XerD
MAFTHIPDGAKTDETQWPWSYREAFIERLKAEGYRAVTIKEYRRAAGRLCAAIEKRGLRVGNLNSTTTERLQRAAVKGIAESHLTWETFCVRRFVDHLVEAGVASAPRPHAKKTTAWDRLIGEYESYLRTQRGLAESTIADCTRYMRRFLGFRFGDKLGDLNAITPEDIVAFLVELKGGARPRQHKALPSHFRSFFKFLLWSGKTKRDPASGLPRVARQKPNNLPCSLKSEEIQRLLEAVRTDDAIGRRNYAMLLLMARLGLRAPEVIAIQLDDINWRTGEILIRGKDKLHDRMPLPADAGEAIVDYIKNGRPSGNSRVLFLSAWTPHHRPFKSSHIVNWILEGAFKRAGLKRPRNYLGSRLLRHSLATDLLRKGASLSEIADVLRHRSRVTTTTYAKYDLDALRSIARHWPVGGDVR